MLISPLPIASENASSNSVAFFACHSKVLSVPADATIALAICGVSGILFSLIWSFPNAVTNVSMFGFVIGTLSGVSSLFLTAAR